MKFVVYKASEVFDSRYEVIEINTLEELVKFYRDKEASTA